MNSSVTPRNCCSLSSRLKAQRAVLEAQAQERALAVKAARGAVREAEKVVVDPGLRLEAVLVAQQRDGVLEELEAALEWRARVEQRLVAQDRERGGTLPVELSCSGRAVRPKGGQAVRDFTMRSPAGDTQ